MMRAYTPLRRLPRGGGRPRRQFMPPEKYEEMLRRVEALLPVLDAPELDLSLAERVHDSEYLRRWSVGEVSHAEELAMGFRWSPEILTRARLSCGGTLAATLDACSGGANRSDGSHGIGINLAGGTHHAYRDRAEGFSFLNDVVIAAVHVLDRGLASRVLVLDLDVHQGNGTARMLQGEPRTFTVSVHGEDNYPFRKEVSDLDVGLRSGAGDDEYLDVLHARVFPAAARFAPDLIFYLAGADVLAGDQLGKLALTLDGVRARDEAVFAWATARHVPVVTVMAGGYNADPDRVVAARVATVEAALRAYNHVVHRRS